MYACACMYAFACVCLHVHMIICVSMYKVYLVLAATILDFFKFFVLGGEEVHLLGRPQVLS